VNPYISNGNMESMTHHNHLKDETINTTVWAIKPQTSKDVYAVKQSW
jgi:hypothetical protein